jgi:sigma-B regulation protein RsbU (phosphoserine phosphatase)
MAKILLVEDNEQNRDMLARRLQRQGHAVLTAADGERAVAMAGSESPDVILMDLNLPVLDGWMATRRIKDAPATSGIPVIALTAHAMSGDRQKALSAGCDDYDTKPIDFARLTEKMRALLGDRFCPPAAVANLGSQISDSKPGVPGFKSGISNPNSGISDQKTLTPTRCESAGTGGESPEAPIGETAARVLVVDDTPANREMLSRRLSRQGFAVETAPDGETALGMLEAGRFDLVLLDVMMPGMNGLEVLRAVRRTRPATELPVIMTTAKDASHDVVEALELGASDYVTKPLDFPVVLARVRTQLSLRRAVKQIRQLERGLERRNAELQAANAQMRADLGAAARVQAALLPAADPRVAGFRVGWRFVPSAFVAGDILNVFRLDERRVAVYLLDVSGHGVAAALLSVTVSRFLSPARDPTSVLWRREDRSDEYRLQPPAKVAARLGERFPLDEATGQYFTLVYGILDVESHTLRFISAGHRPIVHVPREGPATMIDAAGYPIGISDEAYEEREVRLAPGDRLFLYSDGVPEAMNDESEPFGSHRLLAQLDGARSVSLDATLTLLIDAVARWRGTRHVHDDVSVLSLERAEPEPEGQ